MEKRYLMVILLIALLSTHMHHEPSFFDMRRALTTHGLVLSLNNPLVISSLTCHCSSSFSFGLICVVWFVWKHCARLGVNAMLYVSGGGTDGISSRKTSQNSSRRHFTISGISCLSSFFSTTTRVSFIRVHQLFV